MKLRIEYEAIKQSQGSPFTHNLQEILVSKGTLVYVFDTSKARSTTLRNFIDQSDGKVGVKASLYAFYCAANAVNTLHLKGYAL